MFALLYRERPRAKRRSQTTRARTASKYGAGRVVQRARFARMSRFTTSVLSGGDVGRAAWGRVRVENMFPRSANHAPVRLIRFFRPVGKTVRKKSVNCVPSWRFVFRSRVRFTSVTWKNVFVEKETANDVQYVHTGYQENAPYFPRPISFIFYRRFTEPRSLGGVLLVSVIR